MSTTERFWDFSLRVYKDAAVQRACLHLQDLNGADVNVVLFCCWIAASRGKMSDAECDSVLEWSRTWSGHVVKPLRAVRTWMKTAGCSDGRVESDACLKLREKVKRIELEAEWLQQEALEHLGSNFASSNDVGPIDAAVANLQAYFSAADLALDDDARRRLEVIVSAAFDPAQVNTALRRL